MSKWIFIFFIILNASQSKAETNIFDLVEYYKLPPLYTEEDYNRCLSETKNESLYCSAVTVIKPDYSSPTWNLIEEYSKDKIKHFRHDIFYNGICINWCKQKLEAIDDEDSLLEGAFDVDHKYYNQIYKNLNFDPMRNRFNDIVNKCVNLYLRETYGLRGHTTIVACSSNQPKNDEDLKLLFINNAFFALTAVIFTLVMIGTYNHYLYFKLDTKYPASPLRENLMEIFSLQRNYRRLVSVPTNKLGRELRYLQAIRYIFIFVIVFGHLTLLFTRVPIANTQYYEQKFYSIWGMLQLNGAHLVQVFFLISGLLMGLAFKDLIKKEQFNFWNSGIAIAYRYIRLTPVYAIVLFYETTSIMRPSAKHPFWEARLGVEREQCQQNWWLNVLYINNVFNIPTTCMPHTWFIATDFQAFIYGLVFIMLAWRLPKLKNYILALGGLIIILLPALVTYLNGYNGIYMASPEDFKYHLLQEAFQNFYVPFYTNSGNYYIAMVIGLHYDLLKSPGFIKWLKAPSLLVNYLLFPLGAIPILSCYFFYNYEIDEKSWWIPFYTTITKHLWGVMALSITFLLANNYDTIWRKILNSPIWQPLGRLTYCIYLVHLAIERIVAADRGMMVHLTNMTLLTAAITNIVLSTFVALFLCLFVEFPTSAFIKILMKRESLISVKPTDKTESQESVL